MRGLGSRHEGRPSRYPARRLSHVALAGQQRPRFGADAKPAVPTQPIRPLSSIAATAGAASPIVPPLIVLLPERQRHAVPQISVMCARPKHTVSGKTAGCKRMHIKRETPRWSRPRAGPGRGINLALDPDDPYSVTPSDNIEDRRGPITAGATRCCRLRQSVSCRGRRREGGRRISRAVSQKETPYLRTWRNATEFTVRGYCITYPFDTDVPLQPRLPRCARRPASVSWVARATATADAGADARCLHATG